MDSSSHWQGILAALDAHAIVSVTDASGVIVYANERFSALSGYPVEQLLGANHSILRSGLHDAAFYEGMWETIEQGRTWHGQICNRRRDGGLYWVETTIVPLLDAHGLPERYVSIRTDITGLVETRDLLDKSQHFAGFGSWEWRIGDGVISWSGGTAALFGRAPRPCTVAFDEFMAVIHPDDRGAVREAISSRLEQRSPSYEIEHRALLPEGRVIWLLERGDVIFDAEGAPVRMLGMVQDVTERRYTQEQLARSERRWRAVMEQNRDAVLLGDVTGRVRDANAAAERLFGYPRERLIGKHVLELYPEDEHDVVLSGLQHVVGAGESMREGRILRRDGRLRAVSVRGSRIDVNGAAFLIAAYRDVTEQRLIAGNRDSLSRGADPETGLPQRERFMERFGDLARRFALTAHGRKALAVIRLSNLDEIEAAFGPEIRAAVTVAFAERLREVRMPGSLCGRIVEHEFVLGWVGRGRTAEMDQALHGVLTRLRVPFDSAGQAVQPSLTVGTAFEEDTPMDAQSLLNRARVACNHANESVGQALAFDARLERSLARRLNLEQAMRRGIDTGAFYPVYQPQIALKDGALCGVEVLARWRDPDLGQVSPAEFIVSAEQNGLLNDICGLIFKRALSELAPLLLRHPGLRIALNVSPMQLRGNAFIRALEGLVAATRIPTHRIEIEITETAMLDDMRQAIDVLERWRADGFRVAIDDFGTGFSSMDYLRRLPIDRIKIDRSFVSSMDRSAGDAAIVRAILGLAHPLGLECVAEGIESQVHQEMLQAAGCQVGQGHFISAPMEYDALSQWLNRRAALT